MPYVDMACDNDVSNLLIAMASFLQSSDIRFWTGGVCLFIKFKTKWFLHKVLLWKCLVLKSDFLLSLSSWETEVSISEEKNT